ncbi:MAG TPA: hypothetical protein VGP82_24920 [Ktedonobacterales bacterium]|nr:hypothetical protein [Ktedonobacterales bacterium]
MPTFCNGASNLGVVVREVWQQRLHGHSRSEGFQRLRSSPAHERFLVVQSSEQGPDGRLLFQLA